MATIPMSQGPQQSLNNSPVVSQYTDHSRQMLKPEFNTKPLGDLFSKIHQQQVDAQVEADMTDLRREIIRRRFGEDGTGGWSQVLGKAAMEPDKDGLGLVDREDASIQDFANQLAAKQSPVVQKLFREKARDLLVSNYDGLMQHTSQQAQVFAISQTDYSTKQLQESSALMGHDPKGLMDNIKGVHDAVSRKGQLLGWSADETAYQMRLATNTAVCNMLDALLAEAQKTPGSARQASAMLNVYSDHMTPDSVIKYRKQIDDANLVLDSDEMEKRVLAKGSEVPSYVSLSGSSNAGANRSIGFFHRHIVPTESGGPQFEKVPRRTTDGKPILDENGKPIVDTLVKIGRYSDGSLPKDAMYYAYGASQVTLAATVDIAKTIPDWKDLSKEELAKRLRNDPNFNLAVGQAIWNKCVRDNGGDISRAAAAYHAGQGNVALAVKMDKESGGDGSGWFKYYGESAFRERAEKEGMKHIAGKESRAYVEKARNAWEKENSGEVTDSSGKKVLPTSLEYFRGMKTWMTREQIRQAVLEDGSKLSLECRDNPKTLEREVDKIYKAQEQLKADYATEQANIYNQALDLVFSSHGDLNTAEFRAMAANLNATQLTQLQQVAYKIQKADNSSDPVVKTKYMADDGALFALPESELKLLHQSLSVKDYEYLRDRWLTLHHKAVAAQNQKDQDTIAGEGGYVLPKFQAKPEETKSTLHMVVDKFNDLEHDVRLSLISNLTQAIGVEQQIQGRVFTSAERLDFIKQYVNKHFDTITWYGSVIQKPLTQITTADLPNHNLSDVLQVMTDYTQAYLRSRGQNRAPTEGELQEAFVSLMINKIPTQAEAGLSAVRIPQHYVDAIKKALPGRKITAVEALKAFVSMRMRGETVEKTGQGDLISLQQAINAINLPNVGNVSQKAGQ